VDKAEAARFLSLLDLGATYFTFQTFDDNQKRDNKKLARIIHGTLDECWDRLVALNDRGAGIFVTINETDGKGRTTENIERIRALFEDLDGAPLDPVMQSEYKPHIAVESSPKRFHTYQLATGVGLDQFEGFQKALAEKFSGDDVHDLPRVMRLPGFIHRKGEPFLTRIVHTSDHAPYTAGDFESITPAASPTQARTDQGHNLNAAALKNLAAWVPDLFPDARFETGTGAYRATSKSLGRDLKEDLSLHPDGIKDFGLHDQGDPREGRRTPVDIVVEYGGKTRDEAIAWLRERLDFPDRPEIKIRSDNLAEATTRAEDALLAAGVALYQRGETLVRPVVEEVDASHGRRTKVARFVRINEAYLRDKLNQVADFLKHSKKVSAWAPINPPHEVARTLLAREGEWKFPAVAGVVSTPTMRPDGTILDREGYDEATRLLLVAPPPMPPMPEAPTRDDALRSLETIKDLLVEFPLVDGVSKSVALSAMITPVVRGAFLVAPMHAARAPVSGSGKSYLFDSAAAIAIGQIMPVMAAGRTEEETEKRLGAALLTGQPLICIDNVSIALKGDALCQAIERPLVEVRVLGLSKNVRVEARGTSLYCTGNNLVIVGDLCRRVITIVLDPEMERPELREFNGAPVVKILADRGTYVAAALTVCRAYIVAGQPDKQKPLASFEGWSDTVRSALMWLGESDPGDSMEVARREDPERIEIDEVLLAWAEALGTGKRYRFTLAEVIKIINERSQTMDGWTPDWPRLHAAIQAVAARGREPADARSFGFWMRNWKGRIVGERRFVNDPHGMKTYWWVERRDSKTGNWDGEAPGQWVGASAEVREGAKESNE
jgi:hypothetical protein